MTADTLTADGAPAYLPLPFQFAFGADTYHAFSYAVVPGRDEIAVMSSSLTSTHVNSVVLDGYSLDGTRLFETLIAQSDSVTGDGVVGAGINTGVVLVTWSDSQTRKDYIALYHANGTASGFAGALPGTNVSGASGFDTSYGFRLEWASFANPPTPQGEYIDYATNGSATVLRAQGPETGIPAFVDVKVGAGELTILDNVVKTTGQAPVTLPGVPANTIFSVVAAGLADGTAAAVGWLNSGTGSLALFDTRTDSFGPVITLDSGGDSNLHVLALPDGGFAVSWNNAGVVKGEVFDAAGNGGGIITLAGDVAGIDSHGDLYTVGYNSLPRVYMVQTYAISGSSGGGGAGTPGQTFTSDNNGDVWVGTAGNDTFNLGRGGDTVTGNGGSDTYKLAAIPWAGGHITDFGAGDVLNVTGLMSTTSDTGVDGFADGYLKITDDGQGAAQVWANYHVPGNDGWWLVETLDGVSSSNLTHSGDTIAFAASSGGGGTGGGQTFTSDDNGDVWVGTAGNDTFNLGRGGDYVTGNGGNDTYRFAAIPWAGGHITDFNAGDALDLTRLVSTTSDTGTDGFADGYLKITDDGSGTAQVWADYHIPGNDGWWLVETLDGVAPASLMHSGDVITVGSSSGGGSTSVSTSDANYVAPANVTAITLTGSQQHIDASATTGVTITSNDTGNVLIGGAGDDVFHLGRGGDWAQGGAGADTFAYAGTPWAGGGVTDFNASQGDRIDVSGLLAASGYGGSDPFADGYLQLTTDSSGNAQLWSDVRQPGNDGWWLVATLDGVSTSSLHYSSGLIT